MSALLYIYIDFPLNSHMANTNKRAVLFGARVTTLQLYPSRDILEFDRGHETKNQPITVLVLLSESLGI